MQHLCDFLDAMPCHWSPGTSYPPFTATAMDLSECFLLSDVSYLTFIPTGFKVSLGTTSKLAGLHADHRSIAPAWLFCLVTAIHKRDIVVGSIYVPKVSFEVKVPQPRNLPLTGFESVRVPQTCNLPLTGFEPVLLKVLCVVSWLSWWLGHRALFVLIDG